jgi:UDP-2,4-diacetamido-2,4,6-trideoxy-beta-L-altropyranose hydrolase
LNLLIRADSSLKTGIGHHMRCIALAQEARERGWKICWLAAEMSPSVRCKLENLGDIEVVGHESGSLEDAATIGRAAIERKADIVILDNYKFGPKFQKALSSETKGRKVSTLLLDDYAHHEKYQVDMVLNQNMHANEELYRGKIDDGHKLLLGAKYILLRDEFLFYKRKEKDHTRPPRRLLITLGGSDAAANTTLKLAKAALDFSKRSAHPLNLTVVLGEANPHIAEFRALLDEREHSIVIDTGDMPRLMDEGDLLFFAGGTTSWEACYMGLPGAVVVLADNQKMVAASLAKESVAFELGVANNLSDSAIQWALEVLCFDHSLRKTMAQRGRELVDGQGRKAVCDFLENYT